jgi:hypothetical protein
LLLPCLYEHTNEKLAKHAADARKEFMPTFDTMDLQVKVQTVPGFAKGLSDGMPKFIQQEGVAG